MRSIRNIYSQISKQEAPLLFLMLRERSIFCITGCKCNVIAQLRCFARFTVCFNGRHYQSLNIHPRLFICCTFFFLYLSQNERYGTYDIDSVHANTAFGRVSVESTVHTLLFASSKNRKRLFVFSNMHTCRIFISITAR